MPKGKKRRSVVEVAFDTCTVLDAFDSDAVLREPVLRLDDLARQKRLRIVLCQNVIIEAQTPRLFQARGIKKADAINMLRQWFNHDYVVRENVDSYVADRARELAQKHNLTAIDASIAAVAVRREIPLITRDGSRKKGKAGLHSLDGKDGFVVRTAAEQFNELDDGQMSLL